MESASSTVFAGAVNVTLPPVVVAGPVSVATAAFAALVLCKVADGVVPEVSPPGDNQFHFNGR